MHIVNRETLAFLIYRIYNYSPYPFHYAPQLFLLDICSNNLDEYFEVRFYNHDSLKQYFNNDFISDYFINFSNKPLSVEEIRDINNVLLSKMDDISPYFNIFVKPVNKKIAIEKLKQFINKYVTAYKNEEYTAEIYSPVYLFNVSLDKVMEYLNKGQDLYGTQSIPVHGSSFENEERVYEIILYLEQEKYINIKDIVMTDNKELCINVEMLTPLENIKHVIITNKKDVIYANKDFSWVKYNGKEYTPTNQMSQILLFMFDNRNVGITTKRLVNERICKVERKMSEYFKSNKGLFKDIIAPKHTDLNIMHNYKFVSKNIEFI